MKRSTARKQTAPEPAPAAPANDQTDAIYTIPELAKRWRMSRHTITTAIRSGRLQAFKVGERVYRVRGEEVVRFEREHMGTAVAS